jgi:hypothetical protein
MKLFRRSGRGEEANHPPSEVGSIGDDRFGRVDQVEIAGRLNSPESLDPSLLQQSRGDCRTPACRKDQVPDVEEVIVIRIGFIEADLYVIRERRDGSHRHPKRVGIVVYKLRVHRNVADFEIAAPVSPVP